MARVSRGALPGVGTRVPSALGTRQERPARGPLLGGALARPARGRRAPALALYREVLSARPAGLLRHPRGPRACKGRRRRRWPCPSSSRRIRSGLLRPDARYQRAQALGSIGFDGFAIWELEALGPRHADRGRPRAGRSGWPSPRWAKRGGACAISGGRSGAAVEAGSPGLPARLWQLYYPLGYGEHVRYGGARGRPRSVRGRGRDPRGVLV